jgi:hypothetical protein
MQGHRHQNHLQYSGANREQDKLDLVGKKGARWCGVESSSHHHPLRLHRDRGDLDYGKRNSGGGFRFGLERRQSNQFLRERK